MVLLLHINGPIQQKLNFHICQPLEDPKAGYRQSLMLMQLIDRISFPDSESFLQGFHTISDGLP